MKKREKKWPLENYVFNRYIRVIKMDYTHKMDQELRDKAKESLDWLTGILTLLPEKQLKQIFSPDKVYSFIEALFLQNITKNNPFLEHLFQMAKTKRDKASIKKLENEKQRERIIWIASDLLVLLRDDVRMRIANREWMNLQHSRDSSSTASIDAILMARTNIDEKYMVPP